VLVKKIISNSTFTGKTGEELDLLVNLLYAGNNNLTFLGDYFFDVEERNKKTEITYLSNLVGKTSKTVIVPGGIIKLTGNFERGISLNDLFEELSGFYELFGVDFVRTSNKLVNLTGAHFKNFCVINQVPITDEIYKKNFLNDVDLEKMLIYEVRISCFGRFSAVEQKELLNEVFDETPSFFDDSHTSFKNTGKLLEKSKLCTYDTVQQWDSVKYKTYDLVKRGVGELNIIDACNWYANFMNWYKNNNSAVKYLINSPISRRTFKEHGDPDFAESVIAKSTAGQSFSPLTPRFTVKFRTHGDLTIDEALNKKIIRLFDFTYTNKFNNKIV